MQPQTVAFRYLPLPLDIRLYIIEACLEYGIHESLALVTEELPVNIQRAFVHENRESLRYMYSPSETVQLEAVRFAGCWIKYIDRPSEAVMLAAMRKFGTNLKFLSPPPYGTRTAPPYATRAVELAAVHREGPSIWYVKDEDQTEALQLIAVRQNPESIRWIRQPKSDAIVLEAIGADPSLIQYVKNPSRAVQLAAIRKSPHAIRHIVDPCFIVQAVAVRQNRFSILEIKDPSRRITMRSKGLLPYLLTKAIQKGCPLGNLTGVSDMCVLHAIPHIVVVDKGTGTEFHPRRPGPTVADGRWRGGR